MKPQKLKTVFIVEDSTMERTMLKDHLAKHAGLTVKEYSTGDACIKELIMGDTEAPDLILMDYFLDSSFGPAKDGLESLAKIKEIYPYVNVIMLTSVENDKIVELAKKKGALDYVVKSTNSFDWLDTVLEKHFGLKN